MPSIVFDSAHLIVTPAVPTSGTLTATFTTGEETVTINSTDFTLVNGTLSQLTLFLNGQKTIEIVPDSDALVAAQTWAVLQPLAPGPFTYQLSYIDPSGEYRKVLFKDALADNERFIIAPSGAELAHLTHATNTTIYNGLTDGSGLGVRYIDISLLPKFPEQTSTPVAYGQSTGSQITGQILVFNIYTGPSPFTGVTPVAWATEAGADASPGLPLVIVGEGKAPQLQIMRPFGPPRVLELIRFEQSP